jgi:hypothetical protein
MTGPTVAGQANGDRIVQASWAGTALFTVTAGLAVVARWAAGPALVVAVVLFAAGVAAFVAAYVRAVSRSRTDQIAPMALFFLEGCAPPPVRRQLLGSAAVEVAVALATAAARPNTSLAFGILVPVYGVALAGLWGARHGRFARRAAPPTRRRR